MKRKFLLSLIIILGVAIVYLIFLLDIPYKRNINDFETCRAYGFAVVESFPRQCKGGDGQVYYEKYSNKDLNSIIKIDSPQFGKKLHNTTVYVKGSAKGLWFFEASFPVKVLDADGKTIGEGPVKTKGDWMSNDLIPFEGYVNFDLPTTATGTVVFQRANPSDLRELDASVSVPVYFLETRAKIDSSKPCIVSGCSGEVCADESMMSGCVYKPEYACYSKSKCERQSDGYCGWSKTKEFNNCILNINK